MMSAFAFGLYTLIKALAARNTALLGLSVLAVCVAGYAAREHYWRWDYQYSATQIEPGDEIFLQSNFNFHYDASVYRSDGLIEVRRLIASRPMQIRDLQKAYWIAPSYRLIHVQGKTCSTTRFRSQKGEILTKERVALPSSIDPGIFERFQITPCLADERCAYRYSIALNSCFDSWVPTFLGRKMHQLGFNRMIIIESAFAGGN